MSSKIIAAAVAMTGADAIVANNTAAVNPADIVRMGAKIAGAAVAGEFIMNALGQDPPEIPLDQFQYISSAGGKACAFPKVLFKDECEGVCFFQFGGVAECQACILEEAEKAGLPKEPCESCLNTENANFQSKYPEGTTFPCFRGEGEENCYDECEAATSGYFCGVSIPWEFLTLSVPTCVNPASGSMGSSGPTQDLPTPPPAPRSQ